VTNKQKHKKMWMWLAENAKETRFDEPGVAKEKAFWALGFLGVINHCFACESVFSPKKYVECFKCPCDWNTETCTDKKSIYWYWGRAKTTANRKKYALKIANCWKERKKG
jgi:hypothetical protein